MCLSFLLPLTIYGQCNDWTVLEFGDGRVLTHRTTGTLFKEDCETVLNTTDAPPLFFDHTWPIDSVIQMERAYFLESFCKYCDTSLNYDDAMRALLADDILKRSNALRYLICYYDHSDSIFLLLKQQLPQIESERTKARIAKSLSYSNNPKAIAVLKTLAHEPCEFVLIEVGRSLSWLGEKEQSYKILDRVWQLQNEKINLDMFSYFTVGMRNINSPEAITFLVNLSQDKNMYCALDASICLLQLGEIGPGFSGLEYVLETDNPILFRSAARAIHNYFPFSKLKELMDDHIDSENAEISEFARCILTRTD
jgi:hypothetical protein